MNSNALFENRIREALSSGEEGIVYDSSRLETVFARLDKKGRISVVFDLREKTIRFSVVAVVLLVLTGGIIGAAAGTLLKLDKIDYPFVDDQQVIGKWQSVDFVSEVGAFSLDKKVWRGDLYLKELVFIKDGKILNSIDEGNGALAPSPFTWTNGKVLNFVDKTASSYKIVDIEGAKYMFFEWKSGDYTIRGMEPRYYVLRQVDGNDYSNYRTSRITDDTNMPFIDDPLVAAAWKAVDFVKDIDSFDPEKKNWIPDLFLTGLVFGKEGKLEFSTTQGNYSGKHLTWTKGYILDFADQTASAYTIKEIEGKDYMFFEWKSGDYTFRGMQPYYYVLERE